MPYINQTKPAVGDPTYKDFIDDTVDNQVFLNNNIAASVGGLVLNWSFETDADSDGEADGWDYTNYTGGSNALNTANESGGVTCQSITSTVLANGGGYIDSTDFLEVIGNAVYRFAVNRHGSVADISNQMQVTWYTDAQVSISTTTCYQDTDAPTTATRRGGAVIAPATARYAKIRLEGGVPATGTATGVIYFDNVYFDVHETIIGMGDFSSDASLIRNLEQYEHHRIHLVNTRSTSDTDDLIADISTDRQSTWKTGASDYEYERSVLTGGTRTETNSVGTFSLPIVDNQRVSGVTMLTTGYIDIVKPSESYARIEWNFRHEDAGSGPLHKTNGDGVYNGSSNAVTDIRLDMGTFVVGEWYHEVIK